jgi:hypothetical protein
MAFTPEQEAALLVLIAQPPKIISDLESEVSLNGDEVIPVEDGTGTFGATVNDIADYAKTKITFSPITIANNVTDANNDIDFSAGNFQFSDGTGIASLSALTKRLDATWVVGTNQGGLFSGSKANSTWYHCFAIYNPTSGAVDCGFDTSVTAANIPSGYTKYKRVGSIKTNGSANILGFYQSAKIFNLVTEVVEYNSPTPPTTLTALSITAPLGVITRAFLKCELNVGPSTAASMSLKSLTSLQQSIINVQENDSDGIAFPSILTDTSSQIQYKSSSASVQQFTITTISWEDYNL